MPSPRIRVETLVLEADGKRIEVKKPSRMNFDLNKALIIQRTFSSSLLIPRLSPKGST